MAGLMRSFKNNGRSNFRSLKDNKNDFRISINQALAAQYAFENIPSLNYYKDGGDGKKVPKAKTRSRKGKHADFRSIFAFMLSAYSSRTVCCKQGC